MPLQTMETPLKPWSPGKTRVLRWILLCALTIDGTFLGVMFVQSLRGNRYLATDHPYRALFTEITVLGSSLFLVVVAPFFSRRFELLTMVGFIVGLITVACMWLV